MPYKYGVYGEIGDSLTQQSISAGSTAVYFGTAPVHLVRGYKDANLVNTPIKIRSLTDAQKKLGYAADFDKYTLCEAMAAHFDNGSNPIGPVYMINVLDPETHKETKSTSVDVPLSNRRAEIAGTDIILDSITIAKSGEGASGNYVEGEDYTVSYNYLRSCVVIEDLTGEMATPIKVKYSTVDTTKVDVLSIVGQETTDGQYEGIAALKLLFMEQGVTADLLAAPGWSHVPEVYKALCNAARQINGHWDAFVLADMPINDGKAIDTIDKAIEWKNEHQYNDERSKVFWPEAKAVNNIYHLSTLATREFVRIDQENNGIPFNTCGNKEVDVISQYFGEDVNHRGFDNTDGNELTKNGISTVVPWSGHWRLWGDSTAAYNYDNISDIDPRVFFDVNVRMLLYITNSFQKRWADAIDKPMTAALRDTIINREQEVLDTLVTIGALIGNPKIEFTTDDDALTEVMQGNFKWSIEVTPTPPLKSATVTVVYTDSGFSVYFEEV